MRGGAAKSNERRASWRIARLFTAGLVAMLSMESLFETTKVGARQNPFAPLARRSVDSKADEVRPISIGFHKRLQKQNSCENGINFTAPDSLWTVWFDLITFEFPIPHGGAFSIVPIRSSFRHGANATNPDPKANRSPEDRFR